MVDILKFEPQFRGTNPSDDIANNILKHLFIAIFIVKSKSVIYIYIDEFKFLFLIIILQ